MFRAAACENSFESDIKSPQIAKNSPVGVRRTWPSTVSVFQQLLNLVGSGSAEVAREFRRRPGAGTYGEGRAYRLHLHRQRLRPRPIETSVPLR
jgi:hypothetical protein